MSALASVRGSCVVIAVGLDDAVVAGDLAGQRMVFHARTPEGEFLIGSHASRLAPLVKGSIARDWLAARLLVPNASDVWWTGSPWAEVEAVRAGWLLRISRFGGTSVQPLVSLPVPETGLGEGSHELGWALGDAVRARVTGACRPTVDLSGGWDSSTVAVLASRVRSGGLPAITLTVPGVDDADTAADIAGEVPELVHELWPVPETVLPYSDLDAVPIPDEPAAYAANGSRAVWWLRRIAERGSDLHLSGDGGDAVLVGLPAYLGDLARARRMRDFWRHVTGWAALRHEAPQALARAGIALKRTSYSDALRTEAHRLVAGQSGPSGWSGLVAWFGHSRIVDWMTPDARVLVAEQLRQHAEEHSAPVIPGEFGIGDAASWLALMTFGRTQRLYTDMAAACGVNHQTPYLDDAVVRACWSVPAWVRTTPERTKPLLARAMADVVPAGLANRQTKGDYTGLAYRGLRRNAAALHELFGGSVLGDLGLIDELAVRTTIDQAAAGVSIRLGAFDTLVSTELWLRAHSSTPAITLPREGRDRAGTS